jgi:16S rRNA (guanine527-N7)-methyltransferase
MSSTEVIASVEPVPSCAGTVFGPGLDEAVRYADLLVGRGSLVGVIGPREAARIWSRHLLNCGLVAPLIPQGATVADVGSGAGLPGIPIAIARPDLHVRLVESLARRVRFLTEVVHELGLEHRVEIVRARAEELSAGFCGVATARAVANLPTLVDWCLPLVPRHGGELLAIRGESAAVELQEARVVIGRAKAKGELVELTSPINDLPTRVVRIVRA